MEIKLIARHQPSKLAFHLAKAMGYQPPPLLLTWRDKNGQIRRDEVPL